jgi:hypothetical protein
MHGVLARESMLHAFFNGKSVEFASLDPVGMCRAPSLSETSNSASAAEDGGLHYIADLVVLYDLIFCTS